MTVLRQRPRGDPGRRPGARLAAGRRRRIAARWPRGEASSPEALDLAGAWVLPGFVDMHVHGGGGAAYTSGDPGEARGGGGVPPRARHDDHARQPRHRAGRRAGARRCAGWRRWWRRACSPGCTSRGPTSARSSAARTTPRCCGPPTPATLGRLLAAGDGTVRMVTLAPELPGGLELGAAPVAAGAVAAIGHTDATYEQARGGVRRGRHAWRRTSSTRCARSHHREPGPVAPLLEDERVTVELINDGMHLHDAVARARVRVARARRGRRSSPTRWPRPGCPTAATRSARWRSRCADGVARLVGRRLDRGQHADHGRGAAARRARCRAADRRRRAAAATTPARVLGLPTGALEPGLGRGPRGARRRVGAVRGDGARGVGGRGHAPGRDAGLAWFRSEIPRITRRRQRSSLPSRRGARILVVRGRPPPGSGGRGPPDASYFRTGTLVAGKEGDRAASNERVRHGRPHHPGSVGTACWRRALIGVFALVLYLYIGPAVRWVEDLPRGRPPARDVEELLAGRERPAQGPQAAGRSRGARRAGARGGPPSA